ncbi:acyl-CoA-binding protein, putative [Hepatocystis sp. ex Piliocolobus tephrosceles]|nr:acyl-CoA-binding protein, putative [Hepatocystis sp. ex Piliocolobus tephrosceles]
MHNMFKNPLFFINAAFVVTVVVFLKRNNKYASMLLNIKDEITRWILNKPLFFLNKYKQINIPIIDKNVKITLSDKELEEKFEKVCNAMNSFKHKMRKEHFLYLYGLYKQIIEGDIKLKSGENIDSNNNSNDVNKKKKLFLKFRKNSNKSKADKDKKDNNTVESFIENEKLQAWKNCYGVNKKVCKYLYITFFNSLFPDAIEKEDISTAINMSKSISKMKKIKETHDYNLKNNASHNSNNSNNSDSICDVLCNHVINKNITSIEQILKTNPDIINSKNSEGLTPLHYACDRGYLNIVKFLIKNGADVNVEDSYGDSALHIAAYSDKTDIINYLKSVGADSMKTNLDGLTVNSILNTN